MLSRTADHLFWMSRYMERAENTARMVDVTCQTDLLPQSDAAAELGWRGLVAISELTGDYQSRYGDIQADRVIRFMVADGHNLSSIYSCFRAARENARAVRGALTTEVWETMNQTWLEFNRLLREGEMDRDASALLEWVKLRSHLSRGVAVGTMLEDEALRFTRMGSFLERADNTARLLDVKFRAGESDVYGAARVRTHPNLAAFLESPLPDELPTYPPLPPEGQPGVAFQWIEIEGPVPPSERSAR